MMSRIIDNISLDGLVTPGAGFVMELFEWIIPIPAQGPLFPKKNWLNQHRD